MNRYLVFLDIDASYQVFRVISENNYLTHTVFILYTVDCLPREKCTGYLEKVVRALIPFGWDRYIFMRFTIGRFGKNDIVVISGSLKALKGYLVFYPGYEYPVFTEKLEGKLESFYRDLYYAMRKDMMEALDSLKQDLEKNVDTLADITKKFTDILKKYDEYVSKSIGLLSRGSEALTLLETGLVQLTSPPPPAPPTPTTPPPPQPPPKKSIWERIKSIFRRGG